MHQTEKILAYMLTEPRKRWWKATDFMQPSVGFSHPYHVGYEATARMSDAMRKWKEVFEVNKEGKFRALRIKWEDKHLWLPLLEPHLQRLAKQEQEALF